MHAADQYRWISHSIWLLSAQYTWFIKLWKSLNFNTITAIDPENDGYNRIANYCFVSPVLTFENDDDKQRIAQWLTAFAMNGSNKKTIEQAAAAAPLCRAQLAEFPDLAMQMENLRFWEFQKN